MYKYENTCITIRVINSNTGHVVRNEILFEVFKEGEINDSIQIA